MHLSGNWSAQSSPARNHSWPLLTRRTSFYVATQTWQSNKLRSAENIKIGRNGGLLLGPQILKRVALILLSQHTWYLVTTSVSLQVSLAATWLDVLFIVHMKDSAFSMWRIWCYMLFLFHCNNDDVIMRSWWTGVGSTYSCVHLASYPGSF